MKKLSILSLGFILALFAMECKAYTPQKITIENTAKEALANVPVTFGLVFEAGAMPRNQPLQARASSGEVFPLQVDRKATYPDGSLRHAVISMMKPGLGHGESRDLFIEKATSDPTGPVVSLEQMTGTGGPFVVKLSLEGEEYTATLSEAAKNIAMQWLEGPVASEWITSTPFVSAATSESHPHLSARFYVRKYAGSDNLKIDFVLENCTTWTEGLRNYDYGVTITSNGATIYSNQLTHFARARWKRTFWTQGEPAIHIKHDPVALIRTKAVPAYSPALIGDLSSPVEDILASYTAFQGSEMVTLPYRDGSGDVTIDRYGPMGIATLQRFMGAQGGRDEIGPLPRWVSNYIVTQDERAKYATVRQSDLAGSWQIHYRDEATGLPVSIEDHPTLTVHTNAHHLDRPTATVFPDSSPYMPGTAHQPSFNFVPYLVTGDFYHLEEMQFWTTYNLLSMPRGRQNADGTWASWRGLDLGIFTLSFQVRAIAWKLRTFAQVAAFTPDDYPSKNYYNTILQNNIDYLPVVMAKNTYGFVTLGMRVDGEQTWMDDFLTWAVNYAVGLGFSNFQVFLDWKTRFPVQRMGYGVTDNNFCWQLASPYKLVPTPDGSNFFNDINEIYEATFPQHSQYACGSPQFLASTGYPTSNFLGATPTSRYTYPTILGIAIAAAVDAGAKDGQLAWDRYVSRDPKPDFRGYPSWAIVPFSKYSEDNPTDPGNPPAPLPLAPPAAFRVLNGNN